MPFYEYLCRDWGCITGKFRRVKARKRAPKCEETKCKGRTDLTWSTPSVNCWSEDWVFPNLSTEGDGTMKFKDEDTYRAHLKEIGAAEKSLGIREV
jgi:hypothetical protein